MAKKNIHVKTILSEQFALAHYRKNWFADLRSAVKDLKTKEALWKPRNEDHSVWEIIAHLNYWNNRFLVYFKGDHPGEWIGNNANTFQISSKTLKGELKRMNSIINEFDKRIRASKPKKINTSLSKNYRSKWYSILINLSAHTAYHTGQIVMLRKMHRTWNAKKNGV